MTIIADTPTFWSTLPDIWDYESDQVELTHNFPMINANTFAKVSKFGSYNYQIKFSVSS
jgi:hypothetical protein